MDILNVTMTCKELMALWDEEIKPLNNKERKRWKGNIYDSESVCRKVRYVDPGKYIDGYGISNYIARIPIKGTDWCYVVCIEEVRCDFSVRSEEDAMLALSDNFNRIWGEILLANIESTSLYCHLQIKHTSAQRQQKYKPFSQLLSKYTVKPP